LILILNDRCAPAGGAGKGPALRTNATASLSNCVDPELFAIPTRETPPFAAIANDTTAVPFDAARGRF
jgi:hypothetical protein